MASAAQVADPLVTPSGNDCATPIAVVPFGFQGGNALPGDMSNIIDNDLHNSGYFEPLPRQNIISQLAQASEVIFRDWKVASVNYVVVGNIVPVGGCLQVQYTLFDVGTEQQVPTGSVTGSTDQLRSMSHCIADQSFEKLTGIKGAFSIKVLYVTAERPSVDNTRYTLQRSDYDGACPVTLLQSHEPIVSPRFSPDGRRIAYISFEQKHPYTSIRYVDTGHREQITNFEGLNGVLALFPDGNRLASVLSRDGNPEIYAMDLGSRVLRCLTNNLMTDTEPFWDKGGSILYFTLDRGGKPQIYKINVDGGTVDRVTPIGNYNANPKLPVDKKTLVMIHRQQGYIDFQIAAQDLQRGSLRMLSNITLDDSPTVASNDAMLIYVARQQGRGVLMLVSINERVRISLPTTQGDVCGPSQSLYLS